MNILIINCSPVKNGATAEIARIAAEKLSAENTMKSVCIDDYDIHFCRGCRACHKTAKCFQTDGTDLLMQEFDWADKILCISPSYWADVPGQFKSFIDRCTPWCNTHEPHAKLTENKKGYVIALRTGGSVPECERIVSTIEHFYGHLEIARAGSLCLTRIENKGDVATHTAEIIEFLKTL